MVQTDIMGISTISYGRTTIPKEVRDGLKLNDIDKIVFKVEYDTNEYGLQINEKIIITKR